MLNILFNYSAQIPYSSQLSQAQTLIDALPYVANSSIDDTQNNKIAITLGGFVLPNTKQSLSVLLDIQLEEINLSNNADVIRGTFSPQLTDPIVIQTGFTYFGNFAITKISATEAVFAVQWQVTHPTASPLLAQSFTPYIAKQLQRIVDFMVNQLYLRDHIQRETSKQVTL